MKIDRAKATSLLLDSEGSELNIGGSEPGGASKYGISVDALTTHNHLHGLKTIATVDDIRHMTSDLASVIYSQDFADVIHFDELPAGVDYIMLNNVANLGTHGGIKLLQAVLGDWAAPGEMDLSTMQGIELIDPATLVRMLGAAWIAKKHESPNWYPSAITKTGYGHGWTVRYMRVDLDARKMLS
jgi:lysozyme family protein